MTFTVFASLPVALVLTTAVAAQTPAAATATAVEFDVASIKKNVSNDSGSSMRTFPDGRIVATNLAVRQEHWA